MTEDGPHHPRRKFVWRCMTAAAVRSKTLLALDSHRVGIGRLHHRSRGRFLPGCSRCSQNRAADREDQAEPEEARSGCPHGATAGVATWPRGIRKRYASPKLHWLKFPAELNWRP